MTVWLNADQIADRIGVHRKTAMAMMLEMNPVAISGNTRKRYRVSEENLEQWMLKHSVGSKTPVSRVGTGCNKKLKRR